MLIWAWNENSQSAKALGAAGGWKRIKHEGSAFVGGPRKTVLNWGASEVPGEVRKCRIINTPDAVKLVSDKRCFFELANDAKDKARTVEWTTSPTTAMKWWKDKKEVVARLKVSGHSGAGIQFFSDNAENLEPLLKAPLFTVYKPKKQEYRVHVFRGQIIDVQQKKLRTEDDEGNKIDPDRIDFRVRNLENGFIFAREGVNPPPDVLTQAVKALAATPLDFGAVDVIFNEKENMAYVLEINTAPGLEGTTVTKYAEALAKA